MNNLFINVINKKEELICDIPSNIGEITIGNHKETFAMPLEWWTLKDYEKQWKEGLCRLKENDYSCLVSKIQNIKIRPFIEWWLLYKEENKIYIQNHLLHGKEYIIRSSRLPDFTIETCYLYIPPRNVKGVVPGEFVIDYEK